MSPARSAPGSAAPDSAVPMSAASAPAAAARSTSAGAAKPGRILPGIVAMELCAGQPRRLREPEDLVHRLPAVNAEDGHPGRGGPHPSGRRGGYPAGSTSKNDAQKGRSGRGGHRRILGAGQPADLDPHDARAIGHVAAPA